MPVTGYGGIHFDFKTNISDSASFSESLSMSLIYYSSRSRPIIRYINFTPKLVSAKFTPELVSVTGDAVLRVVEGCEWNTG